MKSTLFKVFILILSFNTLQAQVKQSLQHTSDSLATLAINRPTENLYLHTNKDVYEAGEDLWFGGLVLHSQYLGISSLSNIAFVELKSAEKNETVASEMYALDMGKLKGHLYLPDTLTSGEYWLMAFTANSIKHTDAPIKAVKKIVIKGEVVPHILVQTKFDKEFLEDNDAVSGQVRLLTPGGDPVTDTKVVVSLKKGRKTQDRNRLRSDSTGRMNFNLKHKSEVAQLDLLVKIDHDGHDERFERPLPFDKSKHVQLQFMPEGGELVAGLSNMVAFKAVDKSGMPFRIKKATVYQGEEVVTDFESVHDGMGKFTLFARAGMDYTVRIDEPAVDSLFVLPKVNSKGIQLSLHAQSAEELIFGVIQTVNMAMDSVHLMVKQRGVPFWLVSARVKESGMLFRVPLKDLPQGIVEATLFDQNHRPIAERLVFVGQDKRLQISATMNKRIYGVKEKVNLKLTVKDQKGNPIQSIFNLKAVDEVFNSPYAETNMMTHFLLSSDLKGNIHEPAYYFDQNNPSAADHLDLLLLTQGWRNYSWSADHLKERSTQKELHLVDYLVGKVKEKSLTRATRKKPDKEVILLSTGGAMTLRPNENWSFVIPADFLQSSTGYEYILKVPDEESTTIDIIDGFYHTEVNRDVSNLPYPLKEPVEQDRNWDKLYVAPPAAKEVAGVEVVDNKNTYGIRGGFNTEIYKGVSSDYVCSYDILNCTNHRHGRPPIPGETYRYRGKQVIYKAPETTVAVNTFKGFYKIPEFYQPQYDVKPQEKLIPDFRNTLIWESNVMTDTNGEAAFSFFTSDIRSVFNVQIEVLGSNGYFGLSEFKLKVLK